MKNWVGGGEAETGTRRKRIRVLEWEDSFTGAADNWQNYAMKNLQRSKTVFFTRQRLEPSLNGWSKLKNYFEASAVLTS